MTNGFLVVCTMFRISLFVSLTIFTSIIKPSASSICRTKTFPLSPLHNDMEPVEIPTKRLNDSSRTTCSTNCYYDVTCFGFVYHNDGDCSLFSTRFEALYFVRKVGTRAYGNIYNQFNGCILIETIPSECYDVTSSGANTSGRYTIEPGGNGSPINVSREITSEDSWLVRHV